MAEGEICTGSQELKTLQLAWFNIKRANRDTSKNRTADFPMRRLDLRHYPICVEGVGTKRVYPFKDGHTVGSNLTIKKAGDFFNPDRNTNIKRI